MFKHLLVPLDGSHLAEAALPAAMELAAQFDSQITLLRIIQPTHLIMTAADGSLYTDLLTELRQQTETDARQYLHSHLNKLRQQGYRVEMQLNEGEAVAENILETAERKNADTIVMSTHGRGGISRWVFGSVADRVLRQATIPVLLIRAHEGTS